MKAISSQSDDLFAWQTPAEMRAIAELLSQQLGWGALKRAGTAFREAFVACRFAEHRSADAVRLLKAAQTPTPDFAIRLANEERWYETTEADRPGRTRGNEPPLQSIQMIPDSDWVEPEDYLGVIQARAKRKARRAYSRCNGLIIWSNAFPIAKEHQLDRRWWETAVEPAAEAFEEVWVHFKSEFRQIV